MPSLRIWQEDFTGDENLKIYMTSKLWKMEESLFSCSRMQAVLLISSMGQ